MDALAICAVIGRGRARPCCGALDSPLHRRAADVSLDQLTRPVLEQTIFNKHPQAAAEEQHSNDEWVRPVREARPRHNTNATRQRQQRHERCSDRVPVLYHPLDSIRTAALDRAIEDATEPEERSRLERPREARRWERRETRSQTCRHPDDLGGS